MFPYAVTPFHLIPFKFRSISVPNEETGGHFAEASWETKKLRYVPQRLFPDRWGKEDFCALLPRWIEEQGKTKRR
jgi:hypothetical protein